MVSVMRFDRFDARSAVDLIWPPNIVYSVQVRNRSMKAFLETHYLVSIP